MKILSKLIRLASANEPPAPVSTLMNSSGNYCINLKSQPERFKETKRQFAYHGIPIKRFSAVLSKDVVNRITRKDGVNQIANGCLQSHIDLYRMIVASLPDRSGNERPYVAIFEDDILLLSNFIDLDEHFARLPDDWDLVYLGGNYHFHKPEILNEHLIRPTYAFNTHAMLIRIDFLPRLIAALEERDVEVDVKMAHLQGNREGNWYGFTTDFVWQHGRTSAFHTSMWRHQLGLFHYSTAHHVIDQVFIKNYLP